MKKKILLIHTGGTIGMTRDSRSGVLRPDHFYASLLKVIPELSAIADIQVEIPFVFDSAELNFHHWQQLAAIIQAHIGDVDGVVVTHGTDTLAYTASALSYMLHNVPVPVILTGAQKPLGELRSDARNNLINAVELATADIPEVCTTPSFRPTTRCWPRSASTSRSIAPTSSSPAAISICSRNSPRRWPSSSCSPAAAATISSRGTTSAPC
ncbi:MAG: asparaginase [Acidobacteria bacterium]|nr:asparaginase [Acidobacteriota bacterium]